MGYYTYFHGALTLSRPLTFAEIAHVPAQENFALVCETERRETPEGYLDVVTAGAIAPKDGDEVRGYHAEEELRAMVACLPAGVLVSGEIRGDGEESGDVRRYVMTPDGLRELKARLVWDDGYSEAGR